MERCGAGAGPRATLIAAIRRSYWQPARSIPSDGGSQSLASIPVIVKIRIMRSAVSFAMVRSAGRPDRRRRISPKSQAPSSRETGSELQPRLKRDHSWTAIATQTDAQQAGWRRRCVRERSKARLRGRLCWNACKHHAWKPKVRMVEDVEELGLY